MESFCEAGPSKIAPHQLLSTSFVYPNFPPTAPQTFGWAYHTPLCDQCSCSSRSCSSTSELGFLNLVGNREALMPRVQWLQQDRYHAMGDLGKLYISLQIAYVGVTILVHLNFLTSCTQKLLPALHPIPKKPVLLSILTPSSTSYRRTILKRR